MKKDNFIVILFAVLGLLFVLLWQVFFSDDVSYYIIGAVIIILTVIPFFVSFEKDEKTASKISALAIMTALAVASRAVFYLIPQVKPICAVVVVCGVCFGAKSGFVVGALSAFVSNFIFGQGIWTPYQMLALGFCGLIAGLVFTKIKPNRFYLSLYGFLSAFVIYGLIVDLSSVFMMLSEITLQGVLSVYMAGVPFSLAFGISTAVFLFIFGESFVKKISRIKLKYEI